jgi:hypothetical protein
MRKILAFMPCLLPLLVFGQGSRADIADQYKLMLQKAVVYLLSADTAIYKKVAPDFCKACITTKEFMDAARAEGSGLKDALKRLEGIQNYKMDTSTLDAYKASANNLQAILVKDLTEGTHINRQKLRTHNGFIEMLMSAEEAAAAAFGKINTGGNPSATTAVSDTIVAKGQSDRGTTTDRDSKNSSMLYYILLLIPSAIAVYALLRIRRQKQELIELRRKLGLTNDNSDSYNSTSVTASIAAMSRDIEFMKAKLNVLPDSTSAMPASDNEKNKSENTLKQSQSATAETTNKTKETNTEEKQELPPLVMEYAASQPVEPPPPPKPMVFYANYPDGPNGFSKGSLKEDEFNEAVYIIRIDAGQEDKASFQINIKESTLKAALQYKDTYLDKACETMSIPESRRGSGIRNVEPGELRLEGNNWRINKKAKIDII